MAFIMAVGVLHNAGARSGSYTSQVDVQRERFAETLGHYADGEPVFFATHIDLNLTEGEIDDMNCPGTISLLEHDGPLMDTSYRQGFRRIFCGALWEPIVPRTAGREDYATNRP